MPATDPRPADPQALQQLLKIIGSIVAPATLITSLMFYFGWNHARWYYAYIRVDLSLLGLTTQDYLMRSVDALFFPLIVIGVGVVIAIRLLVPAHNRLVSRHPSALATTFWTTGCLGLILGIVGIAGMVRQETDWHFAILPLCLFSGVLLIAYASQLHRYSGASPGSAGRARQKLFVLLEAAAVLLLAVLSMFWFASDYAAAVGKGRVRDDISQLAGAPEAVVFSRQSLSISAPGVREVSCVNTEAAYRYRYEGLSLMPTSSDVYVFLPRAWTPTQGVAIILPKTDSLRIELRPAGSPPAESC